MPSSKIQYTSLDPQVLGGVAQEETLDIIKSDIEIINTSANNIKNTVNTIEINAESASNYAYSANERATSAYNKAASAETYAYNASNNTAINNNASATGTLSQKLSYIINQNNSNSNEKLKFYSASDNTILTVMNSVHTISGAHNGEALYPYYYLPYVIKVNGYGTVHINVSAKNDNRSYSGVIYTCKNGQTVQELQSSTALKTEIRGTEYYNYRHYNYSVAPGDLIYFGYSASKNITTQINSITISADIIEETCQF